MPCVHRAGRARGVASVARGVTDSELRALDAAGVRGVRFNFVKRLVDTTPREVLEEIARRVAPLGWHIVIYFEAAELPQLHDFFASLPTTGRRRSHGPARCHPAGRRGRSSSCSSA